MKKDNPLHLDKLRHSAAHLLAAAVMDLWPHAKRAIGPAIENGFYFDFDFGDTKVTEEDFLAIEAKMREILPTWKKFERHELTSDEAKKQYPENRYKHELIDEFSEKGKKKVSFYKSGSYWDLCRGGHVEHPDKELKYFKLLSVAGAYWRGSEKNPMLTRIYGTAFPTQKELDHYLWQLEEAKKRDNRKLGKELEFFTTSDEVGPGLILWLPKGTIIREEVEKFGKEVESKYGYQRVVTPHITKEGLYIKSGHLPYYANDMFPPMEYEGQRYYVKPMNCPHMHIIYQFKKRSYKEFPIRFAEFGTVYRHEDSGALLGLLRVRGHTTNDAHIYCANEEQAIEELTSVLKMHEYYYKIFGINNYYIELALPDFEKKADKYFDDPKAWKDSISILRRAAKRSGIKVVEQEGSAAFYGPKFDFNITSVIGREFGASTNQLDFGSGIRFNLNFIDKDGKEKVVPYIVHRAPLGSLERFIGFLIEHYAGAFPTWLSPTQVKVLPITDRNLKYAQKVYETLKGEGIRVEVDARNETLGGKIRDAQNEKIPYMLIVGDREEKNGSVRERGRSGKDYGEQKIEIFIKNLKKEIENKEIN